MTWSFGDIPHLTDTFKPCEREPKKPSTTIIITLPRPLTELISTGGKHVSGRHDAEGQAIDPRLLHDLEECASQRMRTWCLRDFRLNILGSTINSGHPSQGIRTGSPLAIITQGGVPNSRGGNRFRGTVRDSHSVARGSQPPNAS